MPGHMKHHHRGLDVAWETGHGLIEAVADQGCDKAKIVDDGGRVIGFVTIKAKRPTPQRPPEVIPDGFDPETERRGCCDPPDPGMKR